MSKQVYRYYKEYKSEYYLKNKDRIKEYHLKNKEHIVECKKQYYGRRKRFVINYYTDGKNCCACCEEKEFDFLTIDHVNGGGTKHRKTEGKNRMHDWLIKNYLPDGFQILCFNCNCAKGFFGKCPHQTKREDSVSI